MSSVADTKTRILDVAEELFSERGFEGVSIRDITDAAGANIAAVNYHFGGKQELIAEMVIRRMTPLNQVRVTALARVEKGAGTRPPRVEDILEAFILPTLTCCADSPKGGKPFEKLLGRCIAEANPNVEAMIRREVEPLVEALDRVLMKALPNLSRTEIFWRLKFTFGSLHHWLLSRERFLPPWAEGTTVEEQTRMLVAFAAAGFKGASQLGKV